MLTILKFYQNSNDSFNMLSNDNISVEPMYSLFFTDNNKVPIPQIENKIFIFIDDKKALCTVKHIAYDYAACLEMTHLSEELGLSYSEDEDACIIYIFVEILKIL